MPDKPTYHVLPGYVPDRIPEPSQELTCDLTGVDVANVGSMDAFRRGVAYGWVLAQLRERFRWAQLEELREARTLLLSVQRSLGKLSGLGIKPAEEALGEVHGHAHRWDGRKGSK